MGYSAPEYGTSVLAEYNTKKDRDKGDEQDIGFYSETTHLSSEPGL
jgi:hypothetical protein